MTAEAPEIVDPLADFDGVIPSHCPPHTEIVTARELGFDKPTYTHTPPHIIGGMTVQTDFFSWCGGTYRGRGCSPLLNTWLNHLMSTWGGSMLGCVDDRMIDGSSCWSTHASGAALDWGYSNPGPGRSILDQQILPLFINNSQELGVQAVHDYLMQRIWRPPGTNSRPSSPSPSCGWKSQSMDSGYWIHIECTLARWGDTRPFDDIDGEPGDPDDPSKPAVPAEPGMLDCLLQEERARLAKLGLPLPP